MFCPNCNHPLRDQAKFCNNCGTTIAPSSASAVAAPATPELQVVSGKAEPTGPLNHVAAAPSLDSTQTPDAPADNAAAFLAEDEAETLVAPLPPPAPDEVQSGPAPMAAPGDEQEGSLLQDAFEIGRASCRERV